VAVTHFFWPLFIAQILWVFLVTWTRASRSPGLLHWQAAAFILGAPLLALAVFQARRPSYIGQASLPLSVVEFFEFGFLFEPDPFATGPTLVLWLLAAAAFGLTVALVVAGMLAGRTQTPASRPAVSDATPVPAWVLGLLAAGSILFTVRLALFVRAWDAHQARITAIVALLPIVIVGLDVLLRRCWPRLQDVLRRSRHRTLLEKLGELRVSTVLAVVPGAMLLVVSLVTPVFVSRTMLLFTPYVVVLVAAGLAALLKRPKVGVPVVLAVLLLHGASLRYYAVSHHEDPIDYRGLAEAWLPRIEAGDAVFVVRHWVTTPIFYYLDAEQNRVVHEDYAQALAEAPARRVWVLSFPYVSVPIGSALDGYRETEQLEARGIGVSLFEKAATESPATGASLGSPMRWVDPLHKTGIGRGVAAIGKGGSWLVDTGAGKDSR
jgi:hypothetical protein